MEIFLVRVFIFVVGVVILIPMLLRGDRFDERQERARGQAYRWGFWTLVLCLLLYGASDIILGRWCEVAAGAILCVCAALTVFAAVCIVKGAYLGMGEALHMGPFAAVGVMNLAMGVGHLADGKLVKEGVLTVRVINLAYGVTVLAIAVVYIAHDILEKREGDE